MTDKFRWLENINSDESRKFYEKHNKLTSSYFTKLDSTYFEDGLLCIADSELRSLPITRGIYKFWLEQHPNWNKPKLIYTKKGLGPKILLDFDNLDYSLDYWVPSPDGQSLIYGTSAGGNEETTLHVIDVDTKKYIDKPIPFAGFTDQGDIIWVTNNTFIYPRMNGFDKKEPADKLLLGTKLFIHTIGNTAENDDLIFGRGFPDTVMMIPTLSSDKSKVYVATCEDELTHRIFEVSLTNFSTKEIVANEKASFEVKAANGLVYVKTNYRADHYRLLMCKETELKYDFDNWDEVLPERDDILKRFWLHKSKFILAEYKHNVSSKLNIYNAFGNQHSAISLPNMSTVQSVVCDTYSQAIYISSSGFNIPTTHYKLATPKNLPEIIWQRLKLKGDELIDVSQNWANSADGEQIPYFEITLNNKTTAQVPTIIYGYGGFNISLEPYYLSNFRPWVLAGGRIVIANLRGGSEFGEAWHKAGAMQNKQNTFNDCIAVAENLIFEGRTRPDTLGVMGGSNGGLLVSAVTVQRPDLFRAGAALVPLTDMFEFYKHQVAEFWVNEYGDPRKPDQKSWIRKWSPYHYKIKSNQFYPALYYETALNDARVSPFHAFKMVAKLNNEVTNKKGHILLRTWVDTGHQSVNISKKESTIRGAEVFKFFANELGLKT